MTNSTKLMKKSEDNQGFFFENDDVRIDIKYSKEARERELIKFTSKTGEPVIFSTEDMLALIREQFKQKDIAASLTTADSSFVPSVEVAVPIYFNANKDIKKDELVQFFAPMHMPVGIALVMEAERLCQVKGKEIIKIPIEEFEEAKETLKASAEEFTKRYFKPQIDALKKARGEDTESTSEETKEDEKN